MTHSKYIQDFFEKIAGESFDRTAILTDTESLTYQELEAKSNQLARYLHSLNVDKNKEVIVGVCLPRKANLIISLLGIFKAGFAYVPLDPNYPKERLEFMINDAQLSVIITQKSLLNKLPLCSAIIVNLDKDQAKIQGFLPQKINLLPDNNKLAYIIYTSGSTGQPKGVEILHRNTVAFIEWAIAFYSFEQLEGVLASTSICFDLSIFEIFVPLSVGGTVILVDNILHLPESPHASRVTLIDTVPSAIVSMCEIIGIPSSVTTVNLAGEALSNNIVQQVYRFDHIQQVYNLYGPSEDTTFSTVALIPKGYDDIPPIGKPISQTEVYLLDENKQPVGEGEAGEIYLTGAGIARGYRNRKDLTAERFLPNPFSDNPHNKMYKTGDIAQYLADGQLKFIGRNDQLVKIRGFRVELGEIEATLETYCNINKAVVILHKFNAQNQELIAYLTLNNNPKNDEIIPLLKSYLKNKLPSHEIPDRFVILKEFPQTLNGKIDRKALPIPPQKNYRQTAYIPPESPLEITITEIWQNALNLDYIGINDNFFDLGGDSLKAIILLNEINTYFNSHIPIDKFLENPTILGLFNNLNLASNQYDSPQDLPLIEQDKTLDLKLDLVSIKHNQYNFKQGEKTIFLTGATGVLGIYLLSQLLKITSDTIYCLVRANTEENGLKRIKTRLINNKLWQEKWQNRIIPVIGDLEKENLGISAFKFNQLTEKIDLIYHCGSWVNIVYPYSFLRLANVKGTREIIKLASQFKTKPIFYISTVDVFSSQKITLIKHNQIPDGKYLCTGYAQSKYVAEQLLRQARSAGIPVTIFRPSNIINFSKPISSFSAEFIPRMLKGCLELSLFPQIDAIVNIVSVDYVSSTIAHLSQQEELLNHDFNLVNPHPISWDKLLKWITKNSILIKIISREKWYKQLRKRIAFNGDNELAPFLNLLHSDNFLQRSIGSFEFEQDSQLENLYDRISCPCINEEELKIYLLSYVTCSNSSYSNG